MKLTLLLLILPLYLLADIKTELLSMYNNKEYKNVCLKATQSLHRYTKDEEYLSLLGFACLKSGYIDRLSTPIANLKSTPQARSNSAYFAVILMQKKLLLHSLIDKFTLTSIKLPTTNILLSKVFDLYIQHKDFTKDSYTFIDKEDNQVNYKLYLVKNKDLKKMVIEKYYKEILEEKYIYW